MILYDFRTKIHETIKRWIEHFFLNPGKSPVIQGSDLLDRLLQMQHSALKSHKLN